MSRMMSWTDLFIKTTPKLECKVIIFKLTESRLLDQIFLDSQLLCIYKINSCTIMLKTFLCIMNRTENIDKII